MSKEDIIYTYEHSPPRVIQVKKQVWDNNKQKFVPREFVRFCFSNREQKAETVDWLTQQFGSPKYQGHWWTIESSMEVWMNDTLFTFWGLKNSKD